MEELKTHIKVPDEFLRPHKELHNIFGDGIARVFSYDFSTANKCYENRVAAVSLVASVCYSNEKSLGSISLFDRLACESHSLPSSSFEFVPVLLNPRESSHALLLSQLDSNVRKYGEWIEDDKYLLTNYRALVYDCEKHVKDLTDENNINSIKKLYLEIYNTDAECKIIQKHFKVFQYKVDLPTMGQMVRHRVNWQVLSRRYVSGKKVPFEFYISDKMQNVVSNEGETSTTQLLELCVEHYFKAIADGVKAEDARRIIPQGAYTTFWGAYQPQQLENFFKLRLDSHAQKEIRLVAQAMQEMIKD